MFGSISPAPFLWGLAGVFAGAMMINIVIVRFVHKSVPVTKETILPVEVKNTAEITA
jgi:hypothetical protein